MSKNKKENIRPIPPKINADLVNAKIEVKKNVQKPNFNEKVKTVRLTDEFFVDLKNKTELNKQQLKLERIQQESKVKSQELEAKISLLEKSLENKNNKIETNIIDNAKLDEILNKLDKQQHDLENLKNKNNDITNIKLNNEEIINTNKKDNSKLKENSFSNFILEEDFENTDENKNSDVKEIENIELFSADTNQNLNAETKNDLIKNLDSEAVILSEEEITSIENYSKENLNNDFNDETFQINNNSLNNKINNDANTEKEQENGESLEEILSKYLNKNEDDKNNKNSEFFKTSDGYKQIVNDKNLSVDEKDEKLAKDYIGRLNRNEVKDIQKIENAKKNITENKEEEFDFSQIQQVTNKSFKSKIGFTVFNKNNTSIGKKELFSNKSKASLIFLIILICLTVGLGLILALQLFNFLNIK